MHCRTTKRYLKCHRKLDDPPSLNDRATKTQSRERVRRWRARAETPSEIRDAAGPNVRLFSCMSGHELCELEEQHGPVLGALRSSASSDTTPSRQRTNVECNEDRARRGQDMFRDCPGPLLKIPHAPPLSLGSYVPLSEDPAHHDLLDARAELKKVQKNAYESSSNGPGHRSNV